MKLLSINDFLKLVKLDPLLWIQYCEIIIVPSGSIILTNDTCHVEAITQYIGKYLGVSREELNNEMPTECLPIEWLVDKYRCIAVWYNGYMFPSKGINRLQRRTLDMLQKEELILSEDEAYIRPATEYSLWLKRKNLLKESDIDNVFFLGYGNVIVGAFADQLVVGYVPDNVPINNNLRLKDIKEYKIIKMDDAKDYSKLRKLLEGIENNEYKSFQFNGYVFDFSYKNPYSVSCFKKALNDAETWYFQAYVC